MFIKFNFPSMIMTSNFTSFSHAILVSFISMNFLITFLLVEVFENIHWKLDILPSALGGW